MLPEPTAGTGPAGPPQEPKPPTGPTHPGRDYPRTIAQAAAEIGVGYHKLRKLVAAHGVQCVRNGRTVRFFDEDIAAAKEQFRDRPRNVVPFARRQGRAA